MNGEFLVHIADTELTPRERNKGSSDGSSRLEQWISKESLRDRAACNQPDGKFLQRRFHPHARFI